MTQLGTVFRTGMAGLILILGVASHSVAATRLTNSAPVNGKIVISWGGRGRLETANQIMGPWTAVTNLSNPSTNQLAGATKFFRLNQTVDATTLHKKVLCGYQGWFRCAGDGTSAWEHWFQWNTPPAPSALTVDMWPDLTEYTNKYPVPGFTYPDGTPAYLFSSDDPSTVNTHFNWMLDYGIDGVVVQRFVTALPPQSVQAWKTNVLLSARAAANRTGRVFAIEYDMSGADYSILYNQLTNDWTWLYTALKIPQDPRYLHQNGKPILILFGFYTNRFTDLTLPQQIVSWFKTNTVCPVTLIGSGDWTWRTITNAGWPALYRSFDGYLPWNTGNYGINGTNYAASTAYWTQDLQAATNAGMFYVPEIYPGFSWYHLNQGPLNQVPREGGKFLWQQFNDVANLGLDWAYLGMFDEVDEGTAIFKVSNTPPTQAPFVGYDGLPTDWYLRLAAEGSKVLSGERPNTATIPISP